MMKQVLMIAEKPNLAQTLSGFLSSNRCTRGCIDKRMSRGLPLFEWDAAWPMTGEIVHYKMSSTYGHVNEIEFEPEGRDWRKDPETLFSCGIVKQECNPDSHVGRQLTAAGRGVDFLVLWLDCDKEGENICFEVMDYVVSVMRTQRGGSVYRAQFSALTQHDVHAALQHLRLPNRDIALSVDARMELDLRIGCAFTRFLTRFFKGKYGEEALQTKTMPFGPCQTPTLGFCVERHMAIEQFKPEPFWRVSVDVEIPSATGGISISRLEWKKKRTFDHNEASMIVEHVKRHRSVKVANVTAEEKRKLRPAALNTVQLLRLASAQLRMSPSDTMEAAERLYMDGFISYPRTETTQYPINFDRMAALKTISGQDDLGQYANRLIYELPDSRRTGQDRGDHPPIVPLKKATPSLMERNHKRSHELYQLVCANFLAGLSSDCIYLEKTVIFDVEGERFQLDGVEVLYPGFTELLRHQRMQAREVPRLAVGSSVVVRYCGLKEESTRPPDYLSESDLIDLMEQHGIGTDASIPVHIQSVFKRNFATLNANRKIVPTPMGIALISAYNALDDDLVKPQIRSTLEKDLVLIADGKAKKEEIVRHVLEIYKAKYRYLTENISLMDSAIAGGLNIRPQRGRETDHHRLPSLHGQTPTGIKRSHEEDRTPKRFHRSPDRRSQSDFAHGQHYDDRRSQGISDHRPVSSFEVHSSSMPWAVTTAPVVEPISDGETSLKARLLALAQEQSRSSGLSICDPGRQPFHTPQGNRNLVVVRSQPATPPRESSHRYPRPSPVDLDGKCLAPSHTSGYPSAHEGQTPFNPPSAASNTSHCSSGSDTRTVQPSTNSGLRSIESVKLPAVSSLPCNVIPLALKVEVPWPESAVSPVAAFGKPAVLRPVVKVEGHVRSEPEIKKETQIVAGLDRGSSSGVRLDGRPLSQQSIPQAPNLRDVLRSYTVEDKDPVQAVHEICQKSQMGTPVFTLVGESGPPHCREFTYELLINGKFRHGPHTGSTKKDAMKGAAKLFLVASGWSV